MDDIWKKPIAVGRGISTTPGCYYGRLSSEVFCLQEEEEEEEEENPRHSQFQLVMAQQDHLHVLWR